jgi:hypothetical protein
VRRVTNRRGWALVVLLALAACTGTQEPQLPTLLVVGSVGPSGPQLSLLEDIRDPAATPPRRLEPVPGSELPLPAPPVSLDVVDRNGSRAELVVLVDDDTRTELRFVDLEGLDPTTPNPLEESRGMVDLDLVLAEVIAAVGGPLCLTEVQVSIDGRYAALLDDGTCRTGGVPDIYVIDTISPRLVYAASQNISIVDILPAGIYVDQARELLYFASGSATGTDVHSLPITEPDPLVDVGTAAVTLTSEPEGTDLTHAGPGIALLAFDQLSVVPLADEAGGPTGPVQTVQDAERVLPDPSGSLDEVVVFAPNRIAVHSDAGDANPFLSSVLQTPVVDATLEPVDRFAYLLAEGGIFILDLIPRETEPRYGLSFLQVEGLSDPRVISWTYAAQGGATGP